MTISFKDTDGNDWSLGKFHETLAFHGTGATPDDLARAYHAMTDGQCLEMAKAYRKLPTDATRMHRSFDDSLVRDADERIARLEAELAQEQDASGGLAVALAETSDRLSTVTSELGEERTRTLRLEEAGKMLVEFNSKHFERATAEYKRAESAEQSLMTLRKLCRRALTDIGHDQYALASVTELEKALGDGTEGEAGT